MRRKAFMVVAAVTNPGCPRFPRSARSRTSHRQVVSRTLRPGSVGSTGRRRMNSTKCIPRLPKATSASGDIVMVCSVKPSGEMADCSVKSETPPNLGFGKAALRLASRFQMDTTRGKGRELIGQQISIPDRLGWRQPPATLGAVRHPSSRRPPAPAPGEERLAHPNPRTRYRPRPVNSSQPRSRNTCSCWRIFGRTLWLLG